VRSPATSEEYPTFAPTGRRMAYIRYGSATSFQVWVAKSDGSLPRALAATPAGDTWPAWSPDGRLIAYKHGSPGDIWVVRPDGTGRRNLTRTPDADEQLPAWLPDGRVTFVRGDGGRERSYGLWVIGRDGDGARLLAPHVSGWADWTR
jgi:TolB protein